VPHPNVASFATLGWGSFPSLPRRAVQQPFFAIGVCPQAKGGYKLFSAPSAPVLRDLCV